MRKINYNREKRSMKMMMKLLGAAFFILQSSFFVSCDDMFEPADENTRQEDAMYEES